MRHLKRYKTDAEYNNDKSNLQWPTVCGIDSGEKAKFIGTKNLAATVAMYSDKKNYTINDNEVQATIVIAHNLTDPCNIELSCEDNDVTINQDTFTNVISAVSTYMTYPLTIADGIAGSKTFEVTAEISSSDQSIEEDAELVVNNISPRVIPITITAGSNSKTYDGSVLSVNTYEITSGALLDGHHIDTVTITGGQTDAGTSSNVASNAVIRDSSNANVTNYYDITYVPGTLTVTKRNVVMTSASDAKTYDGTMLSSEDVYVTSDGFATGEGATYSNFGHQLFVGTNNNTFDYTLNQGTLADNYTITKVYGTLEVTDGTGVGEDPVPDDLIVTITAESSANEYGIGDEVEFRVTATNIYDTEKSIYLSAIEGLMLAQRNFNSVSSGDIIETTATHTIREGDILNGSFTGSVTAYLGDNNVSPSHYSLSATDSATVQTETAVANLTIDVTTTSTPENEIAYDLGESIDYSIMVINDGNVALTNIEVIGELTGFDEIISLLSPGDSITYFDSYIVTENDILHEEVVHEVTATGTSPGPTLYVVDGIDPEPTVEPNGELTVEVTVKSMQTQPSAGSTITWDVTTTNTGNLTIINVQTSSNYGGPWSEGSLVPGASRTYTASHVLTQAEVNSGSITCTGTATGATNTNPPAATVIPGSSSPVWMSV